MCWCVVGVLRGMFVPRVLVVDVGRMFHIFVVDMIDVVGRMFHVFYCWGFCVWYKRPIFLIGGMVVVWYIRSIFLFPIVVGWWDKRSIFLSWLVGLVWYIRSTFFIVWG